MAYRFRSDDHSVEHAVRRIAREQIDKAATSIEDGEDRSVAIHDVRKRCKKLRGLVRLVRPVFELYADENADFREIGRLLGGAREMAVLSDTYAQLAQHFEQIDQQAQFRFKEGLQAQEQAVDPAERLGEVRERLRLARARVGDWSLAADGWEAIGPGLMQTYLRARTALERIGTSHAPSRYHELRKRVKYHWHHMRLLRPLHPKELAARIHLAAEVGDRLGEHHDLAMLGAALRRSPDAFGSAAEVETAQALARRQRIALEEQCLREARRLLAESAESLTERLGAEWAKWRD